MQAFVDLLPTPWRGFMMAGFAAAYMSTVGTQLNWGASYLVNDFYKRFLNKTRDGEALRERVALGDGRFCSSLSIVVTSQLSSVEKAWEFLLAIGAGTGLVLILRWYWWRINAWSEISAMIASFVTSLAVLGISDRCTCRSRSPRTIREADAWVMLITVAVSTVVWLAVTFLTQAGAGRDARRVLQARAARRPRMARVSNGSATAASRSRAARSPWTNWIAGIVAVYATLFGIGKIVFGELVAGFGAAGDRRGGVRLDRAVLPAEMRIAAAGRHRSQPR